MNRKDRRAARSNPVLQQALSRVDQLQAAARSVANVEALAPTIAQLRGAIDHVTAIAGALCDDYQTLERELAIQRATWIKVFETTNPGHNFRTLEATLRQEVIDEMTSDPDHAQSRLPEQTTAG